MEYEKCPCCGASWKDDKNVLDRMIERAGPGADLAFLAKRTFEMYGHTSDNPVFFSVGCIYKEYLGLYDGALAIHCESCKKDIGRFSGKVIDYIGYTPVMENLYYRSGEWKNGTKTD